MEDKALLDALGSVNFYDREKNSKAKKGKINPITLGDVTFTTCFVQCRCCSPCFFCGKRPSYANEMKRCSKCRSASYCCKRCQQKAWKTHKKECRKYGEHAVTTYRVEYNLGYGEYKHNKPKSSIRHFERSIDVYMNEIGPVFPQKYPASLIFLAPMVLKTYVYMGRIKFYSSCENELLKPESFKKSGSFARIGKEDLEKVFYYLGEGIEGLNNNTILRKMCSRYLQEGYYALSLVNYFIDKYQEAFQAASDALTVIDFDLKNEASLAPLTVRVVELFILSSIKLNKNLATATKLCKETIKMLKGFQRRASEEKKKFYNNSDITSVTPFLPHFHYYLGYLYFCSSDFQKSKKNYLAAYKSVKIEKVEQHKDFGEVFSKVIFSFALYEFFSREKNNSTSAAYGQMIKVCTRRVAKLFEEDPESLSFEKIFCSKEGIGEIVSDRRPKMDSLPDQEKIKPPKWPHWRTFQFEVFMN